MTRKYTHEEAGELRDIFRDALGVMKDMIEGNDRVHARLMKEIDSRAAVKAETLVRSLPMRTFSETEFSELCSMVRLPLNSPDYPGDGGHVRRLLIKYREGAELSDRCNALQGLYGGTILSALKDVEPLAEGSYFLFSSAKNRNKADRACEELELLRKNGFLEELDQMWKKYRTLHGKTPEGKEKVGLNPYSDQDLQKVLNRLHPGRIDADKLNLPENLTNGASIFVYEKLRKMERHMSGALEDRQRLVSEILRFDWAPGQKADSNLLFLLAQYRKKEPFYLVSEKYRKDPYFLPQTFADFEPMSDVMEWLRADDMAHLNAYRAMENSESMIEDYRAEGFSYDEYLKASDLTEAQAEQDYRRNPDYYRQLFCRLSGKKIDSL